MNFLCVCPRLWNTFIDEVFAGSSGYFLWTLGRTDLKSSRPHKKLDLIYEVEWRHL